MIQQEQTERTESRRHPLLPLCPPVRSGVLCGGRLPRLPGFTKFGFVWQFRVRVHRILPARTVNSALKTGAACSAHDVRASDRRVLLNYVRARAASRMTGRAGRGIPDSSTWRVIDRGDANSTRRTTRSSQNPPRQWGATGGDVRQRGIRRSARVPRSASDLASGVLKAAARSEASLLKTTASSARPPPAWSWSRARVSRGARQTTPIT
jgi:hypothetical protein